MDFIPDMANDDLSLSLRRLLPPDSLWLFFCMPTQNFLSSCLWFAGLTHLLFHDEETSDKSDRDYGNDYLSSAWPNKERADKIIFDASGD